MRCRKCGETIVITDRQCPKCGFDLMRLDIGPAQGSRSQEGIRINFLPQGIGPSKEIRSEDIDIGLIMVFPKIYYALIHNNVPIINSLVVRNTSNERAENVLVIIKVLPDFSSEWKTMIPLIPARMEHVERNIQVPLVKKRLLDVKESEKAFIGIEASVKGEMVFARSYPTEVVAYNELFISPLFPQLIASYIFPNNDAIEKVRMSATPYLKDLCGEDSFNGYQSRDPKKVHAMAEAMYRSLQQELEIKYINPPASFERAGQKILFPQAILKHQAGTCLDLALLFAGCLERIGLYPLIFLINGHAFLGYWVSEEDFQDFWEKEPMFDPSGVRPEELHKKMAQFLLERYARLGKRISNESIIPLNSITFTQGKDFSECREEGLKFCKEDFIAIVDIIVARKEGIKPIPE